MTGSDFYSAFYSTESDRMQAFRVVLVRAEEYFSWAEVGSDGPGSAATVGNCEMSLSEEKDGTQLLLDLHEVADCRRTKVVADRFASRREILRG